MERWRELDEEEIRRLQEHAGEDEEIPRGWRPSQETIEAISGKTLLLPSDATEVSVQQQEFRDIMATMTPHERGQWGEQAVLDEVQSSGHRILSEHSDAVTTPGYDCVSWDGQTVHVWESKNYSADESGQARDVSELDAVSRERRWENLKHFLRDIRGDAEEKQICEAIRQHRWELHIRYGPDTDVPRNLMDELQAPWEGKVNERQYIYAEMLRVYRCNRWLVAR